MNSTLQNLVLLLAILIAGAFEMGRRRTITIKVASAWLAGQGYTLIKDAGISANAWMNPAKVCAAVFDSEGRGKHVTLTIRWAMAGILGKGSTRIVSVEDR
jgi:hypothetical protein